MSRLAVIFCFLSLAAQAQQIPTPTEGDFTLYNFHFNSGETLPELRVHYYGSEAAVCARWSSVRLCVLCG